MKKIVQLTILFVFLGVFIACEKDSKNGNNDEMNFIVAFKEQSVSYEQIPDDKKIELVFSEVAVEEGSVEIKLFEKNAKYGEDYQTLPTSENLVLTLPFQKGDKGINFTFENLIFPFDRTDKTVQFTINKVNYKAKPTNVQGYDIMLISFDASLGGVITPEIGGASQPNQVYVDLGGKATYNVKRDSWDLAFYSGNDFKVKINGAVYMAAGKLDFTDIDKVKESDVEELKNKVKIGTFEASNVQYIDFPSGELDRTAIGTISENDADNKVYLLNLGFEPGNPNAAAGTVNITGQSRGWKKIRILKRGENYLLQYANLSDTAHKEVLITKSTGFNFTFFSILNDKVVEVEPSQKKWDLNFTVFTNTVDQNGQDMGSYGFSDFIVINRYGGVKAYRITVGDKDSKSAYKEFNKQDVQQNLLEGDLRVIGGTWRDVANDKVLFSNVFYVIQDSKGNFYKMRMLGLMSENGERGHPKFEYSLLR